MPDDHAILEIKAKVDDAVAGVKRVEEEIGKLDSQMKTAEGPSVLSKGMGGLKTAVAALATSVAAIKIGQFFGDAVEQAAEAEDAFSQVESLITSTGGAAGRTAEQLKETASQLAALSAYDDDEILASVTATLLRFGTLTGETFDRAQRDTVDLAARLRVDLVTAAEILGKALLSPGEGLRALKQAGVDFTKAEEDSLKAMVEGGRAADAQTIILGRLEKATRGAAEAYRDSLAGALQVVKREVGEVQQAFGEGFLDEVSTGADNAADSLRGVQPAAEDAGRAVGFILQLGAKILAFWPMLRAASATSIGALLTGISKVQDLALRAIDSVVAGLQALASAGSEIPILGKLYEGAEAAATKVREVIAGLRDGVVTDLRNMGEGYLEVAKEQAQQVADTIVGASESVLAVKQKADEAAPSLVTMGEEGKKAGEKIKAGVEIATKAVEELVHTRSRLPSLGDNGGGGDVRGLHATIDALRKKQEQSGLTAEELARLIEAEDQLSRSELGLEAALRGRGGATSEAAAATTDLARATRELDDVEVTALERLRGGLLPTLGEVVEATRAAKQASIEQHGVATQVTNLTKGQEEAERRLADALVAGVAAAKSSTAATNDQAGAIAGLAAGQAEFNSRAVAGAEATGRLGEAAGKTADELLRLKEANPAAFWEEVEKRIQRCVEAERVYNAELRTGIDLVHQLARTIEGADAA